MWHKDYWIHSEVQSSDVWAEASHSISLRLHISLCKTETKSYSQNYLQQGVLNLQDLMSDNWRWSCCSNNRNKGDKKCNVLESSWNHPLTPGCGKTALHEISAWCQKGWRQLLQGSGLGFINSVSTATFRTPVTRISCKLVAHGNSYDVIEMGDVWTTFERSDSAWEWSQDLNLNSDQWTICVLLGQRGCL